jgi:hypothetical protein
MGDYFQKLAAPAVARSHATVAARQVRTWLQEQEIIVSEPSDCVLSSLQGYRPGLGWRKAVAPPHDAPPPQDAAHGYVHLTFGTDGVEIVDTPTVYWINMSPDPFGSICPRCGVRCDSAFAKKCILPHIRPWLDGDDTAHVCCPHCGGSAGLLSWRMDGVALAHFGLVFWNWPPIADHFLAALAGQAGSEIITLSGKL